MVKKMHDPSMRASKLWPDRPAEFGRLLFEEWLEALDDGYRAQAADTLMRGSNAGNCVRSLFYRIGTDVDPDPPTPSGRWRMGLGTMVHDKVEAEMVRLMIENSEDFAEIQTEPTWDLTDQGVSMSGHGDLLIITHDGKRIALEIKTMNGYGFKKKAFKFDGGPEGPSPAHVRQLALAVQALDCQAGVLLYVSMENAGWDAMRPTEKELGFELDEFDKFMAEWVWTREEMQPVIDDEMRRLRLVSQAAERGLPIEAIPRVVVVESAEAGGRSVEVTDPKATKSKGAWAIHDTDGGLVEVGQTWVCAYCPFRNRCAEDE